ncbi:MAG: CAP domain-containing protein [Chitinophagaceae bacterium]|nr:CAP domain-containing protein [Chitinophagaceae bacterium]
MKKRLYLFLPVILAIILFSCKKDDAMETTPPEEVQKPDFAYGVNAADILDMVNEVRKSGCNCGATYMPPVSELTWNDALGKAAYAHSGDMKNQNYFSHTGSDNSNAGERITAAGYSWITYGENIALGQTTERMVMNSWLKSEEHCKNIMNAGFKEMGVGRIDNYWTQVFAAKK